jgi:hypothetical protein
MCEALALTPSTGNKTKQKPLLKTTLVLCAGFCNDEHAKRDSRQRREGRCVETCGEHTRKGSLSLGTRTPRLTRCFVPEEDSGSTVFKELCELGL